MVIFWITFQNISIFLWISILPEPTELTHGTDTPCEPFCQFLLMSVSLQSYCLLGPTNYSLLGNDLFPLMGQL